MTNAYASMQGRSFASTLDADFTGIVNRLRAEWTKYRTYRQTLSGLRDLSARTLSDIGFNRGELAQIARREVYGH